MASKVPLTNSLRLLPERSKVRNATNDEKTDVPIFASWLFARENVVREVRGTFEREATIDTRLLLDKSTFVKTGNPSRQLSATDEITFVWRWRVESDARFPKLLFSARAVMIFSFKSSVSMPLSNERPLLGTDVNLLFAKFKTVKEFISWKASAWTVWILWLLKSKVVIAGREKKACVCMTWSSLPSNWILLRTFKLLKARCGISTMELWESLIVWKESEYLANYCYHKSNSLIFVCVLIPALLIETI